MKKAIKQFRPDFWITPTVVGDHPDIEPFDEKVYATIYWFQNLRDGKCTASNNTIAKTIKPNNPQPRSVQNSLTRLEDAGFIARIYKDKARRNRKEIKALVSFGVRNGNDRRVSNETAVIPERNDDDRRERNGRDQSYNTKVNNSNDGEQGSQGQMINDLIAVFEGVNPNFEILFKNKTQRGAMERMLKKHGFEKMQKVIEFLPTSNQQPYAPTITTPYQLEKDMGKLLAWSEKQKNKQRKGIVV